MNEQKANHRQCRRPCQMTSLKKMIQICGTGHVTTRYDTARGFSAGYFTLWLIGELVSRTTPPPPPAPTGRAKVSLSFLFILPQAAARVISWGEKGAFLLVNNEAQETRKIKGAAKAFAHSTTRYCTQRTEKNETIRRRRRRLHLNSIVMSSMYHQLKR